MQGSLILKGCAWDLFEEEGGRQVIKRLPSIVDSMGREVGPNDIFASDTAAAEFVENMASRGNEECLQILKITGGLNDYTSTLGS